MTTRSTPAKGASRPPAAPLFSPTGSMYSESAASKPRPRGSFGFGSLGYSGRRPSGNDSQPLRKGSSSSAAGPSNFTRKMSTTSSVSMSTPLRRRDGGSKAGENLDTKDWSNMEADEVFRKLGVVEVRRVELTMRADAANKQSELRSMVGTRYRDLLTSATQITSLRESSLHLSGSLKSIAQSCLNSNDNLTAPPSEAGDQREVDEIMGLLPVAAHMKLLLDAPEALYSHLAHHIYLKAAFLWLVARATKEGLSSMSTNTDQAYTPLLEKQWEILVPFRAQISQRATASLRQNSSLESQTLCETLLAVILLDNLPIPEALALFLSQRTKCCRDILSYPGSQAAPLSAKAPGRDHRSSQSVPSSARPAPPPRSDSNIDSSLSQAIKALLATVKLAEECFAPRSSKDSQLSEMIRLVQRGEPLPPLKTPNSSTSTHHRRASRLASFSTPIPKVDISPHGPPISSARVLQDLPSHQILLRHLPNTITAYTPFIAPSSTPDISFRLKEWGSEVTQLLQDLLPPWLDQLHSVAQIWKTRSAVCSLLGQAELDRQITAAFEAESSRRIYVVWKEQLEGIVHTAETEIKAALAKILLGSSASDTIPDKFTFAEPPFPTATSALTSSAASFNTFLGAIRKQKAGRTPLLDAVLSALESKATALRDDSRDLPESLYKHYGENVEQALTALVQTLRTALDGLAGKEGDKAIDGELLVGRVSIFLARSSTFLSDLSLGAGTSTTAEEALLRIHADSVITWRKQAVSKAKASLTPIFEEDIGPEEIKAMWQGEHPTQPSAGLMSALFSLVSATRRLGIPAGVDTSVIVDLMDSFFDTARGLKQWEGLQGESAAQAAFDHGFLVLIEGGNVLDDRIVEKHLAKIPSTLPSSFTSDLPALLLDHVRRTQLLLHPLLAHLPASTLAPSINQSETKNGLLRFGATKASGGVGTEFKSPIAVATPGKRFPLLSITA